MDSPTTSYSTTLAMRRSNPTGVRPRMRSEPSTSTILICWDHPTFKDDAAAAEGICTVFPTIDDLEDDAGRVQDADTSRDRNRLLHSSGLSAVLVRLGVTGRIYLCPTSPRTDRFWHVHMHMHRLNTCPGMHWFAVIYMHRRQFNGY